MGLPMIPFSAGVMAAVASQKHTLRRNLHASSKIFNENIYSYKSDRTTEINERLVDANNMSTTWLKEYYNNKSKYGIRNNIETNRIV